MQRTGEKYGHKKLTEACNY